VTASATHSAIEAVWRIESAKVIAGVARMVRDIGLAEEFAQEALLAALETWPGTGVPDSPGAWLMATAKNRALDHFRRDKLLERKHEELTGEMELEQEIAATDREAALIERMDDDIGDDLLRLVFVACHPVLSTERAPRSRCVCSAGLTTDEIARAFLAPEPTIAQRIVRAKAHARRDTRPLRGAAQGRARRAPRIGARGRLPRLQRGLLGDGGRGLDAAALCEEALRLGRILAELAPGDRRSTASSR